MAVSCYILGCEPWLPVGALGDARLRAEAEDGRRPLEQRLLGPTEGAFVTKGGPRMRDSMPGCWHTGDLSLRAR